MLQAFFAVLISIGFVGSSSGQTGQASEQSGADSQIQLAGKIIGKGAFDDRCYRIGTIEEVVLDDDGNLQEVIVDVSFYLGVEGKRVALSLSEIKLQQNGVDDKCPELVRVLIDKDQLSQKQPALPR